jgi:hypothetical protein
MSNGNRTLYFQGFVYFAAAPIVGFFIMAPVANPRAMLSLHLATWLAGAITCAAAAAWPHLELGPTATLWAQRGLILGLWFGFAIGLVQALSGTSTMFAGGGAHAPAWAEATIKLLQLAITVTLVPALITIAVGLGKSK